MVYITYMHTFWHIVDLNLYECGPIITSGPIQGGQRLMKVDMNMYMCSCLISNYRLKHFADKLKKMPAQEQLLLKPLVYHHVWYDVRKL